MVSSLPTNTGLLGPKAALRISSDRLARLQLLEGAKHLSPDRREVIQNLVRAQAAVVYGLRCFVKRLH